MRDHVATQTFAAQPHAAGLPRPRSKGILGMWQALRKRRPRQTMAFAALLIVSCVPSRGGQLAQVSPAAQDSRVFVNIANQGTVEVSDGDWEQRQNLAIDGDVDTWWSAEDFAPQWLEITLPHSHYVERIELIPSQIAPGPATHKLRLESAGNLVVWHRFDTDNAADGRLFALKLDPPQLVDKVRILTTRHEGWVAWREVRLLSGAVSAIPISGLEFPVQLTHAGDGSGRLFIVERRGRVRIVKEGMLVEAPFLDVSARLPGDVGLEQGLLNVAFPPFYADGKQFYVSYTQKDGDTIVSRFTTSAHPDRADPDSEEILLTLNQFGSYHNGGTLRFGPRDGYLYVASGDGEETDSQNMPRRPQHPGALLGKILRIDVESGAYPYAIPPDNPFVSRPGYAPEIWALGLRNPWGMAFDRQTGDLYIPDTGWYTSEEVNFQPAASGGGENYGWPHYEGTVPISDEAAEDDFVMPVAAYDRTQGCAVVGGAVQNGQFIYADYCTGQIWSLRRQEPDKWQNRLLTTIGVPVSSIGADESGNLYAVGHIDGKIYPLALPTDVE